MASQGAKRQKDKKRDEQKQNQPPRNPSHYQNEESETDEQRNLSTPGIRRNRPHNSKFDRDEREKFDEENRDLGGEG